jgi:hypothetical protein
VIEQLSSFALTIAVKVTGMGTPEITGKVFDRSPDLKYFLLPTLGCNKDTFLFGIGTPLLLMNGIVRFLPNFL